MSNIAQSQTFINYISQRKKCFVTRQNKPVSIKFKIDSSINDSYYFQIINSNNQVVSLSGRTFQIYGSLVDSKGQTHILFYNGNGDVDTTTNVIHFRINTFTQQYLNNIHTNKIADVTIVETTGDTTNVVLRDQGIFYKRPYLGDVPPGTVYDAGFGLKLDGSTFVLTGTVLSGDNSTISINNNIISCIGGGGSTYTAGEGIGISDQNVISLTATIPSAVSQLINDSSFISGITVEVIDPDIDDFITYDTTQLKFGDAFYKSSYNDKIVLDYSYVANQLRNKGIATTGQIPTSVIQLDGISAYYKDINAFSPLKIDASTLDDQSSGKIVQMWIDQNILTNNLKNDYGFATTGMIPLSTSQLTNDSGFITNSDLTGYATKTELETVSGAIPTSYVTSSDLNNYATTGMLDTVSSAIPLSTSQLTNDSGFLTEVPVSDKELIYFDQHDYDNNEALQYVSGYNIIYTKNTVGGMDDLQPGSVSGFPVLSNGEVISFEQWCYRDWGFAMIDINGAYNNITVVGDVPSSLPAGTTTVVLKRRIANINGTVQQFISYAYCF